MNPENGIHLTTVQVDTGKEDIVDLAFIEATGDLVILTQTSLYTYNTNHLEFGPPILNSKF